MANLGELLAELRHDWGLKQEELADILHLSKSTISSYERGQQLPPLDKLVCLADFFWKCQEICSRETPKI